MVIANIQWEKEKNFWLLTSDEDFSKCSYCKTELIIKDKIKAYFCPDKKEIYCNNCDTKAHKFHIKQHHDDDGQHEHFCIKELRRIKP